MKARVSVLDPWNILVRAAYNKAVPSVINVNQTQNPQLLLTK